MPLNRYQIRNEYSLADPELYKAADKDDPEALLEGVAMAGLVGVLRQLGDLAEFAAEIFHDLHEEVMATAARGHSLTIRVQQLEAEFPLIERAFLSQTNHSSFFYNTGIDWHPNLRVDQSMVTQGDLPRFVMDSYEECRGPPRLFLLDKFDVAGAGACLKRYTDPSCFKVERSPYAFTSDVQRDKKARKTKKRGSRWRNGETPEVLHTSHAKLHQLFLEERIENGINVPAHRVKLKRKLNGFPFDPKTGKSYMNKFLEVTSPEYKVVHDKCIDSSSPLRLPSTNAYETLMDTEDVGPPSPDKQVMQRDKCASSSPPQVEETYALKPCLEEVNETPSNDEVQEISRPRHILQSIDTLPSTHSLVDEKEIQVDGERRVEASNDCESDDVASEVDTYVDALATMESELDTDSEQRAKRNLQFLNSRRQVFSLSSSSEKLQAPSSDSHSIENSTLSDDGNGYFKKEVSDFSCSDSPSASDGSALLESEMSSKETKTSGTSYDRQSVGEDTQLPQPPIHGDSDKKCITNAGLGCASCDSGEETTTGMRAETNGKFAPLTSTAEDPENLHFSSPSAPEQNVDDSLSGSSIEGPIADDLVYVKLRLEEDVSSASYPSDVPYRASGNLPWSKSPKIQQERKSDNDRVNLANNLPFTSELLDDPSHDIHELSSSVNQNSHNLDCEDPFLGEDSSCLYNLSDGPSSKGDDIIPPLLAVNNPNHLDGFDNESSIGISDASVQGVDLSTSVKEHGEHSWLTISHDQSAEDTCMTKPRGLITTELDAGDADEEHEEICGAFSAAVTSEQGDLNQNCGVDRPDFLGVLKPVISVTANDIWPLEPGKEEISCSIHENLVDALSTAAFEEKGDCAPSEVLSAPELIHPRHLESTTKEAVLSDESENKRDKLNVTDGTASLAASAHKGGEDDLNSSLYQEKFPEDSICLIRRSSQNELELDQIHLPDSHSETKVEKPMADSPESNSSVHDMSDSRHPQSEVLATSSDNELSFRAENTKDLDTASCLPPSIHCSLDTAQVPSERSVATEDPLDEENDELEDDQLNEELMDKAVVNVDQSPLMEQIEPSYHADVTFDASSESLLANLPREAAVSDVLAHSSNKDPQPLLTDYCTEEGAESAIYQDVKMEVLDRGEAMSEPHQVGSFDLEQASISLSTPSLSQPSFPEFLSPSNEDNLSSLPTHLPNKEDNIAQKKLDKETLIEEGTAKMELDDVVGVFDESSRPSVEDVPSQSSVSNSFSVSNRNINPFEHENIMISTSPGFAGESQIDVAEMPPLPPLPPMQWIMTKTHSTSDLDRESTPHHIGVDSLNLAPRTDQNSEPVATENTELLVICSADNAAQSGQYYEAQQPSLPVREEETQPVNSILDASSLDGPSIDAWGSSEELNQSQDQVAPDLLSKGQGPTDCAGIKPKEPPLGRGPADASESFCHEPCQPQPKHQPLHHLARETSLNRSNFEESTTSMERNVVTHDTVVLSPYTENDKSDHIIPTSDAENIWPSVEEANANEIRPVKLQRPRTPLIDDLASHDKSKLRKVTERVRPEIDKVDERDSILQLRKVVQRVRPEIENVDERDSLLEQIRKKSFNLKPTVATRPSIQGPQTNLRVAAILEKAKTIRQAFAGSDEEDDEDSWSDS